MPNGQIANVNIETLSARDKFWFHHFVGLRYETTPSQMRAVLEGVCDLLVGHSGGRARWRPGAVLPPGSVLARRRDLRLLSSPCDWDHFLEIQQDLLLRIMEIVERAGTEIALPSQTLTLADARPAAALPR